MTTEIIALVVIVLILDVPLLLWWEARQRDREDGKVQPAHERAKALAERALEAYRSAQAQEKQLNRQDLRVRALMAASGRNEMDGAAQAAWGREADATLQVLVARLAEEQERDLAVGTTPDLLTKSIAEARDTVMRLVPSKL